MRLAPPAGPGAGVPTAAPCRAARTAPPASARYVAQPVQQRSAGRIGQRLEQRSNRPAPGRRVILDPPHYAAIYLHKSKATLTFRCRHPVLLKSLADGSATSALRQPGCAGPMSAETARAIVAGDLSGLAAAGLTAAAAGRTRTPADGLAMAGKGGYPPAGVLEKAGFTYVGLAEGRPLPARIAGGGSSSRGRAGRGRAPRAPGARPLAAAHTNVCSMSPNVSASPSSSHNALPGHGPAMHPPG